MVYKLESQIHNESGFFVFIEVYIRNMKRLYSLLLVLFIISCDDPSLDNNMDDDMVIEPVFEITQLASITVAENTPTNVIRSIDFNYNANDLLEQTTDASSTTQFCNFEYSNANRLEQIEQTINALSPTIINISTGVDSSTNSGREFIRLQYTNDLGALIEYQLFTDQQNRIDQVIINSTDSSGITNEISNRVFIYSQNFNVNRINNISTTGITTSFTEFTYNFNNNPFKDMNDVIRLFLFDEFNPYSRNLPATREDYTVSNSGVTLDRSIDYTYTLDQDGFPTQRELLITANGNSTTFFEFFNYRP